MSYTRSELNSRSHLVDLTDNKGRTALSIACKVGDVAVIKYLLDASARPTEGMLSEACLEGKAEVMMVLINYGVRPTQFMLNNACAQGKIDIIMKLLDSGVKPAQALLTPTMLEMACNENRVNLVKILIDNKVSSNSELFARVCEEGKLDIAQVMAAPIARELVRLLRITSTLEQLGVEKKIVGDTIQSIVASTVKQIDARNISTFNASKIKSTLLYQLEILANDQHSILGQSLQRRRHPKMDAFLSGLAIHLVPKKLDAFKAQYKKMIDTQCPEAENRKDTPANR